MSNSDRRDFLYLQLEAQAAEYNRQRAYFPTARDVAKAYAVQSNRSKTMILWTWLEGLLPFTGSAPL